MSYSSDFADKLNEKFAEQIMGGGAIEFGVRVGSKYDKITQKYVNGGESVHAFVDRKTGDLYKAAGWKAPAKGIRFTGNELLTTAVEAADIYGRYLYR